MTTLETVAQAVAAAAPGAVITTPRPNELHCNAGAERMSAVAALALNELGASLILITADDRRTAAAGFFVHYLFAHRAGNWFLHVSIALDAAAPRLQSIAALSYVASRFERELADLFGIVLVDHPDPSPLVKHGFWPADFHPLRKDAVAGAFTDEGQPFPFTQVGGEGVYEIPVGPVHAGVIEPGHFRFSVMGETVINLRTRLYFTHKGTEKLFEGREAAAGIELAERVSGDSTVAHAMAFAQAVEAAGRVRVPDRAALLRVILLEMERLYNHVADVGAIANDTGFAIAHAHCFRIRERLLRANKRLTGSRLLRGLITPGGLTRDCDVPSDFVADVCAAVRDFAEVMRISLTNTLVMDRLEATGVLSAALARDHGVLGYVARASGLDMDARRDHPFAAYARLAFRVPVYAAGDVYARTCVRIDEVEQSARLIEQAAGALEPGAVRREVGRLEPFTAAFGVVEGWRGRTVHWIMAAADGTLHRTKIVDPSFFNWPALSYALEGNIVPDFPLCNKSFNQSYSGNDL